MTPVHPDAFTEGLVNLGAWIRDYAYALRWQGAGVLRRAEPGDYRRFSAPGPAVVLLPGIYERWTFLLPVADVLRDHGFDVHAVADLGYNGGTIEEMAHRVDRYIRRASIRQCVLVAHSKGGLIGKQLLAHHNRETVIRGLVALNTPFNGSALARLLPLPALRVFLPHSPELTALTATRKVNRNIVSIYGRFDPHIPGGSHLEGARNVRLATRGHFLPLGDSRAHAAVLEAVRSFSR